MTTHYPLTIYFDASCRLCNSEMQNIKRHDFQDQLRLIDCSAAEFDDTPFQALGFNRELMLNRLHVQDAQSNWIIGVPAFELIYQSIGMTILAQLWGSKLTRPITEWLYPWVVKHRALLSKTGLPAVIDWCGKRAARKAEQRSQQCRKGRCETDKLL